MGMPSDWLEVLLLGALYGGWMLFWTAWHRRDEGLTPAIRRIDTFVWAPASVWVGVVDTFHWHRAFSMPLVLITAPTLIATCLVALFARNQAHQ